jgi:MYND finger
MTSTKARKQCEKDSKKKKCKAAENSKETEVQNAKNLFGFSETQCHNCGISNDDIGGFLLQCATCKRAYYCGMKCFNENLPFHQKFCNTNLLESEPIGRRDIVPKKQQPEEQVGPTKPRATTGDASKQKKSKASSLKQKKSEATPKKQGNLRKTFVDSSCSDSVDVRQKKPEAAPKKQGNLRKTFVDSCSDSVVETESESESETKADRRTSATGSSANHEGSVSDNSIEHVTVETPDPDPVVSTESDSKSLVLDESFAPDITTNVQNDESTEPGKEE